MENRATRNAKRYQAFQEEYRKGLFDKPMEKLQELKAFWNDAIADNAKSKPNEYFTAEWHKRHDKWLKECLAEVMAAIASKVGKRG